MKMNFKKWFLSMMALILAGLILLGGITAVIDPFFHYHAPLDGLEYKLFLERYQNDGILRFFDYDAVITGNSLSQPFSASLADELFGVKSVKVPFVSASVKELDQHINTALRAKGEGLKLVIMSVDYPGLVKDKDYMCYDKEEYPTYLYDKNPLNDVKYLFNKSVLKYSLEVLTYTRSGQKTTSFDDYSNWDAPGVILGRDVVMSMYRRPADNGFSYAMDSYSEELLMGNLRQNYIATVSANPNTDFYFVFPPYGILFFDKLDRQGTLELQLEAEKRMIEELLKYDNVRIFSFMDEFELIEDFDRYKDYIHFNGAVNDWMLRCMAAGEHELTEENYGDYCLRTRRYFTSYDYDALFE